MKNIVTKAIHIASHPGKLLSHPFKRIFERHYSGKKLARTLFTIDVAVLATIALAVGAILYLTIFRPAKIVDLVRVDATVAPTDIVSGGLSTLVIRFENDSQESLRHARLQLSYPAHFELKDVQSTFAEIAPQTYDLGSIEPGASGSIKLHGVMFGDVGGSQTFGSALSFVYGKLDKTATKTSEHTFSPSHSTLALQLVLPSALVAGQSVNGQINYKNTGDVDFPTIAITPEWPKDFSLTSSSPALVDGRFSLSALKAGEEGTITFTGTLPSETSVDFTFHPSFTFDKDSYTQDTLKQTVQLLPSQITVTTSFDSDTITPNSKANVTVTYEHTGSLPIENLSINLGTEKQALFAKNSYSMGQAIATLKPGEKGSLTLSIPLAATIGATTATNITDTIKTIVSYSLPQENAPTANITVVGATNYLKVTSPVVLESFGRYTSPQGDQIGRGFLPPVVDEETSYWMFMTVRGTTNALENVKMDAKLGDGVVFTGKQSISYGESLNYDPTTNSVEWTIGKLPPTLGAGSQVVSVAFEVAITPTSSMIGKKPTLLASPLITAHDTFTGSFVTARGSSVTTDLPNDEMAKGLGVVEK